LAKNSYELFFGIECYEYPVKLRQTNKLISLLKSMARVEKSSDLEKNPQLFTYISKLHLRPRLLFLNEEFFNSNCLMYFIFSI
jgi:hypothetical protein